MKKKDYNKRILISIITILLIMFIYILRLLNLQVFDFNDYKRKGDIVSKKKEIISPERGEIYDSNGKPLAINVNMNTCYLYKATNEKELKEAKEIVANKKEFSKMSEEDQNKYNLIMALPLYEDKEITKLSKILDIDKAKIISMLENKREGFIAENISDKQKLEIDKMNLSYIKFYNEPKRYYPNEDMMGQVLGFVQEGEGIYGLEKQYDEVLTGEKGYIESYKALGGTSIPFDKSKAIEEKKSLNIITTLDENIQKIIREEIEETFNIEKPIKASVIIMDPNTGKILGMDSGPSFNPNSPRKLNTYWDKDTVELLNKKETDEYLIHKWNNPVVTDLYEPGSVFKSIVTAMTLENRQKVENEKFMCTGSEEIAPGVFINCWRKHDPHGEQTLEEAFSNSCNPAYVQLIKKLGKEDFFDYGESLRFGKTTGVDLPNEQSGLFPKDSKIADVDFGPMSYGHSLSVTPIQMLSSMNSTVNGGHYYRPYVVEKIVNDQGEEVEKIEPHLISRVFSDNTSRKMNEYYANNFEESFLSDLFLDLNAGIKTGTSLKIKSDNIFKDENNKLLPAVASIFISYPAESPKYTILAVVDEPLKDNGGAGVAGRLGLSILEKLIKYEEETLLENQVIKNLIKVPNLHGKTVVEAKQILDDKKIRYNIDDNIGDYHIISSQFPDSDGYMEKTGEIKLGQEKSEIKIKVPNLKGMKIREVKDFLERNHIPYEIRDNGNIVKNQKPVENKILLNKEKLIITTE